ncbi:MAG TPA: hypothetical protein VGN95_05140 [Pyrinomonadaceae bacterium]|jgi:hypothetical protein|nr:hypothetical protein [Pyrinomonadaceae bacterium]
MWLYLSFEGYFQMRMATDPDPSDEPRGVSGYTFALAGEPDFDNLVHLQPDEEGVVERRFGVGTDAPGPRVGVTVRQARLFDDETLRYSEAPEYLDARVSFVKAQLTERNGIVIRNDLFAIDPLRVQLRKKRGTLVLDREDFLDPNNPDLLITQATSEMLERRQPQALTDNSVEVAKATGLPDASNDSCINNRRIRQKNLEELLKRTRNPVERAALETRISQLNILRRWWDLSQGGKPVDRRARQLTLQAYGWDVDINGTVHENKIGADENTTWPLSFWMGGWDGDALCAYISGYLSIPLTGKV